MFIDTHTHLDLPSFDADRGAVLDRARQAGVEQIVTFARAGHEGHSVESALDLAARCDLVRAAVGIHPHDCGNITEEHWAELDRWLARPEVALLGDIGLDYRLETPAPALQREAFRRQIRLAGRRGLPISVHCRDAWDDLFAILREEYGDHPVRGVLHAFNGSLQDARRCVGLGLLVSFSGRALLQFSRSLLEVAYRLRLDQIVLETDAPYLAPHPHRGERNEPAYVVHVAAAVAHAMGVSLQDVARNTTRNFQRLVGPIEAPTTDHLVYEIGDRLYINLTNRCTASCVFCSRKTEPVACGYDLGLTREHGVREYLQAIGSPRRYREVVFCGFGEPTIRLAELVAIARGLKSAGAYVRLNTNGHGNLIHGRDIVPELAACLHEVSISLNAADPISYARIVRPDFGAGAFDAAVRFAKACVGRFHRVTLTAVDLPGTDLEACRRLALSIGAQFRVREYQEMVGSTDFAFGSQG